MSEYRDAIEVLLRSQKEMVTSIVESGVSGGIGRSQQYAAGLVTIQSAINLLEGLDGPGKEMSDRMAAVRAAKSAK